MQSVSSRAEGYRPLMTVLRYGVWYNAVYAQDANENRLQRPDSKSKRNAALNILRFRRIKTKSLRAGCYLPSHKAFDFFTLQDCSRLHDKVFGYLGLTNSRIQVDHSLSVLDLFVGTLADHFLSGGFITQELTRKQFLQTSMPVGTANSFVTPVLAFGLDFYDPVVDLLFHEVANFFVPLLASGRASPWAWYLTGGNWENLDLANLTSPLPSSMMSMNLNLNLLERPASRASNS